MTDSTAGAWVHRQAELQAQRANQARRWREAEAEWVERFESLTSERDELRKALRRTEGERDDCSEEKMELRAEVDRLKQENASYRLDWLDSEETAAREVHKRGLIEAEVERLEKLLTDADWRELDEKRKVEALAKHNGSLMMDAVEREKEVERMRNLLAECFPLVRPGTDLNRRLRETLVSDKEC